MEIIKLDLKRLMPIVYNISHKTLKEVNQKLLESLPEKLILQKRDELVPPVENAVFNGGNDVIWRQICEQARGGREWKELQVENHEKAILDLQQDTQTSEGN